jgi:hypothetical protein
MGKIREVNKAHKTLQERRHVVYLKDQGSFLGKDRKYLLFLFVLHLTPNLWDVNTRALLFNRFVN